MYQVSDYILYGSASVCQVTDIRLETFSSSLAREYYVLNPVFGNKLEIYIPTDSSKVVMRRVIHLIRMLYDRKMTQESNGKRLASGDADIMKAAEKLLHNE